MSYTCPSCNGQWTTNYCPQCGSTIERSDLLQVTQGGSGWPATAGVQRWALAVETLLLERASEKSAVVSVLKSGEEVNCEGVVSGRGFKISQAKVKLWYKISLVSGQKGYVPSNTLIRRLLLIRLQDTRGEMRRTPEATSSIVRQLVRGDTFLLVKTIKSDSGDWIRIRSSDGQEGFLNGKAKIKQINVKIESPPSITCWWGA